MASEHVIKWDDEEPTRKELASFLRKYFAGSISTTWNEKTARFQCYLAGALSHLEIKVLPGGASVAITGDEELMEDIALGLTRRLVAEYSAVTTVDVSVK